MGFFKKLFGRSQAVSVADELIDSPLSGKVFALSEIEDEVFASGVMGDGIAIQPTEDRLVSPVDGKVVSFFRLGPPLGLKAGPVRRSYFILGLIRLS